MATAPQFATTPNVGTPATLTAANTAVDGTGSTGRALIFTAGSSGSYLKKAKSNPKGTNIKTVQRFFLNNGSDPEVAGNNVLIAEMTIPANTLDQDDESITTEEVLDMAIPASFRVYSTLGTAVAAGVHTLIEGGNY